MFDARSILDVLLGGSPRRQGRPGDPTVFKDMLDQLGDQGTTSQPGPVPGGHWTEQRYPTGGTAAAHPEGPAGGTGLEDMLRSILTQIQQGQGRQSQAPADGGQAVPGGQPGPAGGPEVGVELQDLLRQILQGGREAGEGGGATGIPVNRLTGESRTSNPPGSQPGSEPGSDGGLAEALRQVLGQATAGAREGAARIDEATGLSDKAIEALGQATGQTPEELVAKLRQLIAENRMAAGAALGGLGALVLGTGGGRSLAATAIKLGGLALIGGLGYKAYQNYQQGKPPPATASERQATLQALAPAPEGSGFEPGAVTHNAARRCIRAMIAAAATDGRIDADEQQRILGSLRHAGLDDSAQQFLAAEITSPATVAELASGIASPEEAIQVYTAARIAVDPDRVEEHAFLSALAEALGIDETLAAQVDAAARGAAA